MNYLEGMHGELLDVRHDKAMLKVAEMAKEPEFGTVSIMDIVYNDKGQTTKTYQLDKRQSIAVASKLNTALLMRIIDRWQELEAETGKLINRQSGYGSLSQALTEAGEKVYSLAKQIQAFEDRIGRVGGAV